jgi:hypothetical protein
VGPFAALKKIYDELVASLGCLWAAILFILILAGVIVVGLFGFGLLAGGDDNDGNGTPDVPAASGTASPSPEGTSASTPTSEDTPASEDARSTRVGNLDLELLDVHSPYDAARHAAQNTANLRIDLAVTANGDGGGYFTAYELAVADDTGAEYGPASCLDCPGAAAAESMQLSEHERREGSAYFQLPEDAHPTELIYRSSAANAEGRIPLD